MIYSEVVIDYQPNTMTVEQKKVSLNTELYLSVTYHLCNRHPSVNLQYVQINNYYENNVAFSMMSQFIECTFFSSKIRCYLGMDVIVSTSADNIVFLDMF